VGYPPYGPGSLKKEDPTCGREVLFIIYNKLYDYYKALLILRYPRVTYYLKAFLDLTHGYLAKKGPGLRGPMGPTRGFWSSLVETIFE
jgi:hypothetical protein